MTTGNLLRRAVTAGALIAATLAIAPPAEAAPTFSSCDKLTRAWPNGVAKSAAAATKQVQAGNSRPASSPKARAVYWANYRNLDRDRDGTACES